MEKAKEFMSGCSQAVRILNSLQSTTKKVMISARGKSLLLTPVEQTATWDEFFARHIHPEFELPRDTEPPQKRELL